MPSPPLPLVQSLSPRIAILTSDDVVDSCAANGCAGLEELLRPWESSAEMVQIMSSTLTPTKHPTFPLRFVSYSSVFPHPESSNPNPDIVVDVTSSLVGSKRPDEELHYPITRSLLLSSRPIAGHETFNHPVGMLLAISTSTPDPLGTLQRLQARVMGPMSQVIPWMDGINVLKFHVVVHDVSKKGENLEEAYDLLAGVKKTYGPHSTLLVINSQISPRQADGEVTVPHPSIPLPRPLVESISQTYATALSSLSLSPNSTLTPSVEPSASKVYGARLSGEDTTRLVALVKELVTQSLVPWMEARIREWNEVWHSNRRGITGRLFGAGRKFFSSRPNSPAPNAQGYNSVKGYYPVTSIEALSRRLADFGFMLRDYRFASTVYDSLRRDFAQDRAWRYAAAATEMYGLSLLLSHSYFHPSTPPTLPNAPFTTLQHTDISSWLEQAVLAYQGRAPANQIQLDALRVTVLYYEAWKMIGEWRGVAMALVRGAGEADEVPSAVMIEEAAAVDVRKGRQGKRRRAFHLVLAARRYETTGLKTFSRRCLDRASALYRTAPWTAAQDLVEYSLGRQAYTLGESDVAVEHFLRLLAPREGPSQSGVLEDLKLAYEQLEARADQSTTAELPVTIFQTRATRIVLPHASTSRSAELEAQLLAAGRKVRTPIELEVSLGETMYVDLVARNPLDVELVLSNLALVSEPPLDIPALDEIILQPNESRTISFDITPTESTTFTVTSISYLFHGFFPVTQSLAKRGQRLHSTKAQRLAPTYAQDKSLTIAVGSSRPRLRVELEDLPSQLYQGEVVQGSLILHNTGSVPIDRLEMITTDCGLVVRPTDTTHNDITALMPSTTNRITQNTPILLSQPPIPSGDTAVVPVTFTALTTGSIDLSGLVIFGEESAAFSASVEILPLLDARAWVELRRKGLLALEVSNSSDIAVTIDTIETVSPHWQTEAHTPYAALLPNQTTSTLLALSESPKSDLEQSDLVTALGSLIQGTPPADLPEISPQSLDLSTADPSYIASRQRHRLTSLQAAFPTIPPSSFSRVFPLLDPLDVDIKIHWSSPHSSRRGVVHLHGIRVAPEFSIVEPLRKQVAEAIARGDKATRTMYEETGRIRQQLIASVLDGVYAREDDPVCMRVKVEGSEKGKVSLGNGSIKVVFQLENRSPAVSVRWILQLPSTSSPELPGMDPARFTSSLHHRGSLELGQSKDVAGTIWVDRPGLISLDGWELAVETGQKVGDAWEVRRDWVRRGEGQWIEVV